MASKLTEQGRKDLDRLEKVVREGLKTALDVAQALFEIHERKLYKEHCSTFEAYVQVRFRLSRAAAYRHITAARAIGILSQGGDTQPSSVGQALALAEAPPEYVEAVWEEAVESSDGKPTPKTIEAAVDRVVPAAVRTRRTERRAEREAKKQQTTQPPERVEQEPGSDGDPETPIEQAVTAMQPDAGQDDSGSVGVVSAPVPELGTGPEVGLSSPNEGALSGVVVAVEEAASLPAHVVSALAIAFIPLTRAQLCAMTDEQETRLTALSRFCQTTVAARRIALAKPAAA